MSDENSKLPAEQAPEPLPVDGRADRNPRTGRFLPGKSGNVSGRGNSIWSIWEWIRELGKRPPEELRNIIADPQAPSCKVAGACCWLRVIESEDFGTASRELLNMSNREMGKPRNDVHHHFDGLIVTQQITLAMLQMIPATMPFNEALEILLPLLENPGGTLPPNLKALPSGAENE